MAFAAENALTSGSYEAIGTLFDGAGRDLEHRRIV
jgi:hypothetical protein